MKNHNATLANVSGLPAAGTLRLNLNMLFDPKTALQRGETLFFGDACAAVQAVPKPAEQAEPSPAPCHHSEQSPYHMAMYLHGLIKVAVWLSEDSSSAGHVSLPTLLTVIEERAADLERTLDCHAGCDGWPPCPPQKGQTGDTPILRMYRQHQEIKAKLAAACDTLSEESLESQFYAVTDNLEHLIEQSPTTCAADFAAKAILATCKGDLSCDWEKDAFWIEARALIEDRLCANTGV